jgi:hypothetical protein
LIEIPSLSLSRNSFTDGSCIVIDLVRFSAKVQILLHYCKYYVSKYLYCNNFVQIIICMTSVCTKYGQKHYKWLILVHVQFFKEIIILYFELKYRVYCVFFHSNQRDLFIF